MGTIIPVLIFLLILVVVVTIHELGHFLMARRAGIFVKEFAIGMGPRLLTIKGKKRSDYPIEGEDDVTHFTLRALPVGGFCAVRGQDEEMPDNPEAMGNKSVPKRMWFILGGSIFNFIAALVLFFVLTLLTGYTVPQIRSFSQITVNQAAVDSYGEPYYARVQVDSAVQQAGLLVGDRITHINGTRVSLWENFRFSIDLSAGRPLDIRVVRDGQRMDFSVTPVFAANGVYQIGFIPDRHFGFLTTLPPDGDFRRVGIWGSFTNSVEIIGFHIRAPFRLLTQFLTRQPMPEGGGIAGPIGIAGVVTEVYQAAIQVSILDTVITMLFVTALINVALGVMNLMPIPALDGARFLFLMIEAVRRKPVSQEREGMVHLVGFVIIIALGIFLAYRDIVNLL